MLRGFKREAAGTSGEFQRFSGFVISCTDKRARWRWRRNILFQLFELIAARAARCGWGAVSFGGASAVKFLLQGSFGRM